MKGMEMVSRGLAFGAVGAAGVVAATIQLTNWSIDRHAKNYAQQAMLSRLDAGEATHAKIGLLMWYCEQAHESATMLCTPHASSNHWTGKNVCPSIFGVKTGDDRCYSSLNHKILVQHGYTGGATQVLKELTDAGYCQEITITGGTFACPNVR